MKLRSARDQATAGGRRTTDLQFFLDWVDHTPSSHTIRGMYVAGLVQTLANSGYDSPFEDRIQSFREYPMQRFMEVLLDAAVALHPSQTVHEGLRSLGTLAIPTFAKSLAGGVVMATVGRSWDLALTCVSKGYEISLRPGKCEVLENRNGRALVQLTDVWNFCDTYQVGVMQGLMDWCGLEGTVQADRTSMCDASLTIEWRKAAGRSRGREGNSGHPAAL